MTKQKAEKLVHALPVIDGSDRKSGEKWTYEEAVIMGEDHGMNFDYDNEAEFYFILNYFYSIFCRINKENIILYACAWFYDVAAKPDKTKRLIPGLML